MSAIIDKTPENLNYLSPLNFKFLLKRAPHVEFFIQKVNIPRILLKQVDTGNHFVKVPYPGDHIDYGELRIVFKVDENLENYLEIHNWIKALGFPENYKEYKDIHKNASYTGKGLYSDITISVLSNIKTINYDVMFVDCFPITLSDLEFKTTDPDVKYLEASATFKYSYYDILKTI